MGWEAWFTGSLVAAMMGVLAMTRAALLYSAMNETP